MIYGLSGLKAIDPIATLAVHCGNGFDPVLAPIKYSFDPIQFYLLSSVGGT